MSLAFVQPQQKKGQPNQAQIQKMLDENNQLIQAITDYQNKGKASECMQYQQMLHRNLVYLATLADSNQNLQALLPPPGQMFDPSMQQSQQSNPQIRPGQNQMPHRDPSSSGQMSTSQGSYQQQQGGGVTGGYQPRPAQPAQPGQQPGYNQPQTGMGNQSYGNFGNQQPGMMSQSQPMVPQQQQAAMSQQQPIMPQQQQPMMSQGQIISGQSSSQGGTTVNPGQRPGMPMQSGYRRGPSQGQYGQQQGYQGNQFGNQQGSFGQGGQQNYPQGQGFSQNQNMQSGQQYGTYQGQDQRFPAYNRPAGQMPQGQGGSVGNQIPNQGQGQMGVSGPSKMTSQGSMGPGSNTAVNQMSQGGPMGTQVSMSGQVGPMPGQGQNSMPGQNGQMGMGPNSVQMDNQMVPGHGQMGNQMSQGQMGNQMGQGQMGNQISQSQPNFPFNQNQFQ